MGGQVLSLPSSYQYLVFQVIVKGILQNQKSNKLKIALFFKK
jgi:hypothetical protein